MSNAPQPLEDDPEDSLFLPDIDSFDIPHDNLFSIRPSDPPSSYRQYEAFPSSQIITGTAPEHQSSAQSDSYKPDAAETSKSTTEPTTEVSAETTASNQVHNSVSIDTESRTVVVIPDSQSQQASLSSLPSQTQNDTTDISEESIASQATGLSHTDQSVDLREVESSSAALEPGLRGQFQTKPRQTPAGRGTEHRPSASSNASGSIRISQPSQASATEAPDIGANSPPAPDPRAENNFVQPANEQAEKQRERSQASEPATPSHPVQSHFKAHSGIDDVSDASQILVFIDTETRAGAVASSDKALDVSTELRLGGRDLDQVSVRKQGSDRVDATASGSSYPLVTQIAPSLTQLPQQAQAQPAPQPQSQPVSGGELRQSLAVASSPKSASVPLQRPSPGQASSPLPSVPSHSVQAIGASAPPRPATPSTPTQGSDSRPPTPSSAAMSTPGGAKPGFAEQMRILREKKRAENRAKMSSTPMPESSPARPTAVPARINEELAAETPSRTRSGDATSDRGRSPSAVPAVRPVAAATQDEMNTSERYPTLVPTEQDRATLRRQSTITAGKSGSDKEARDSMHAVPIALTGHQRDAYPTMIHKHKDLIAHFLSASEPDEALISNVEELLERLRRITVHPDLDNTETFTQYSVEPSISATWDVDCSVKFRFLKQLCEHLREKELTIAVVAQAGRLQEILETFFAGIRITCNRIDNGYGLEQDGCALTVNIMSSNEDASTDSVSADIVVALDGTANSGCSALKLLQDNAAGAAPLLLSLVVPNTVEHIESCLSPTLSARQRLRALINGVSDLRLEAGKLEEGQASLQDSVAAMVEYLKGTEEKEWPLAPLSMLENLDSQTESEIEPPSAEDGISTGEKRAHDTDEMEIAATASSSKRPRIEQANGVERPDLPMTINPLDIEITHISDSVAKRSQSLIETSDLAPVPGMSDSEKRLQALLHEAQAQVADHAQALADLQYRHEDQRTQLIEIINERDSAIATAQKAVERMTEISKTSSTLRTERDELKTSLMTAQAALLNHSIPERAEFERLRQTTEQAVKDKADLERRLKTAQDDLDYARDMYQTSSSQAQALASQTQDLENRLSHAQNRATGEQARARQMTLDTQARNMARENKQLKQRLQERETSLRVKDEELSKLREVSRGRMGTRGSSVPRSPRMASPMKLAGGGSGSRQGSPAAGDLRSKGHQMLHPLRQG